ncbi:IclR family transcriptional regulator [Castellaniella sp. S9]|uniref:IclR family transcriptional regulator n=1 Tax=Castellaniella sp. S9 TaxID=2993652 RepID=UPI0022B2CE66|nr:IclR family transcriptional regulator [Castellaniella sp. S9]
MTREGVAAVDRALTILDVFIDGGGSLTLTDISKRSGFYKSTTLRLAESLEKFGYLRRLEDGTYRLGPKPLYLGSLYQKHFRSADLVVPVLRKLVNELQEGASFFVREKDSRVCLHRVDAPRSVRDSVHEGDSLPLRIGASGHVMLAFSGETGAKYDAIRRSLHEVSVGERDPEIGAVAAPVFSIGQELAGVISVSGPKYRFSDDKVAQIIPILAQHAATLSEALGGRWPGTDGPAR